MLSRLQVLNLYLHSVDKVLLGTRLSQLLNMLTPAQRNTVWTTIKSDIVAVLNNQKTSTVAQKAETVADIDANIASIDARITDVNASTP